MPSEKEVEVLSEAELCNFKLRKVVAVERGCGYLDINRSNLKIFFFFRIIILIVGSLYGVFFIHGRCLGPLIGFA